MESTGHLIAASAVARSLNIIGDRWSLLILRDIFLGRHRFEELHKHSGTPRGTLTKRLQSLVLNGVLYRNPYQTAPTRYEYRLTDKGLDLYPVALAVWRWEIKWGGYDNSEALPLVLRHKGCGNKLIPSYRCGECGQELSSRDISYRPGPAAAEAEPALTLGTHRRAKLNPGDRRGTDTSLFHITDAIGDRRTALVLSGAFWGLRRYDDFHRELNIATNVLADRLKLLVEVGLFTRKSYQDSPPRYEYKATEKAHDLYPLIVALHQWGSKWLEDKGAVLTLVHKCSQKPIRVDTVCNHCHERLHFGDIQYALDDDN
ncbi:MAG: helix-turn-helix transcriptional regulator [Halieaceae bacterium]|jgi:DNA-binding HxlR family transcriptional regulator|nr:helix-turn-helix transcriptional regulator [Halieaceae bacterium]